MRLVKIQRKNVPRRDVDTNYPRATRIRYYEKRLGHAFIELCLFFNIDWRIHRKINSVTPKSWFEDLRNIHDRAKDEANNYYDNYGYVDGKAIKQPFGDYKYYFRKPQIGDEVTIINSNTESDQLYIENEVRPSLHPIDAVDYHQSKEHASGDARWTALTEKDYDVIHEGGRWVRAGEEWIWQDKADYFRQKQLMYIA